MTTLFPWGDEFHSLRVWQASVGTLLTTYDGFGSGLALPLLQRLASELLGPTPAAARAPALIAGTAVLLLVVPVARRAVGVTAAALTALAVALDPALVFYSHFGRSYSLAVLLALALVHALQRAPARGGATWGAVALWAALLPYAHLSALGFVAAAGAGAAAPLLARDARPQRLRLFTALAAGGLLCALLYLPAWRDLARYLARTAAAGTGAVSALDVATLLAGGRAAGALLIVLAPVAGLALLAQQRARGALPVCAALIPVPLLLLADPRGGPYAYARYLLPSLPFAFMLVAWLWVEAARRALPRAWSERAALGAGAALLLAAHLAGPLGPARADDGPYGNTYLALRPLVAFDRPFEGTPRFYRELSRDATARALLVTPPPFARGLFLYRNYFLQHGVPALPLRPRDVAGACDSGAQLLVLHREYAAEVQRYWLSIFPGNWERQSRDDPELGFLRALEVSPLALYPNVAQLEVPWTERFGEPAYRDDELSVWRLDGTACPGAGRSAP